MQDLSGTTAWRFYPSEIGHLKNIFGLIVDKLRYQYRPGFYPPDENSTETLRQLKVRVLRSEAIVRARDSYRIQTQQEKLATKKLESTRKERKLTADTQIRADLEK